MWPTNLHIDPVFPSGPIGPCDSLKIWSCTVFDFRVGGVCQESNSKAHSIWSIHWWTGVIERPGDQSEVCSAGKNNIQQGVISRAAWDNLNINWDNQSFSATCPMFNPFSGLDTWYSIWYTLFEVAGKWISSPGKHNLCSLPSRHVLQNFNIITGYSWTYTSQIFHCLSHIPPLSMIKFGVSEQQYNAQHIGTAERK